MATRIKDSIITLNPEIVNKRVQWTGRFLQCVLLDYKNSAGELIRWEAFQRVNCNGIVAIVPFTSDGYVILTKQFRPPVNRYIIEFPAGLNDKNESLEEAARRELLEETGYEAETLEFLCSGPLSSGASTEILSVFLARDVVFIGNQALNGAEEIEVIRLSFERFYDDLSALTDKETYVDLKIPGLFEFAKRKSIRSN